MTGLAAYLVGIVTGIIHCVVLFLFAYREDFAAYLDDDDIDDPIDDNPIDHRDFFGHW
jgi:hypothetical protein